MLGDVCIIELLSSIDCATREMSIDCEILEFLPLGSKAKYMNFVTVVNVLDIVTYLAAYFPVPFCFSLCEP